MFNEIKLPALRPSVHIHDHLSHFQPHSLFCAMQVSGLGQLAFPNCLVRVLDQTCVKGGLKISLLFAELICLCRQHPIYFMDITK